jgi:YHS domain-containing protein
MKSSLLILALTLFCAAPLTSCAADKDPAKTGVPAGYPLTKCVVSGESLGEMGKAVKVSHNGTDVYLCCKSCIKDFNKDPEKYTKMVKDASGKKS